MFKRRLAVLGTVAVLAVTGLAGSALADDPSPTAGAKVTCTTPDGKVVEVTPALPAEPGKKGVVVGPDGKVTRVKPGEAVKVEKLPDGSVAVKAEPLSPEELEKFAKVKEFAAEGSGKPAEAEELSPEEAGKLAKVKVLSPEEAEKLAKAGELTPADAATAVPAVPALPAEGAEGVTAPEGDPGKAVKIICKKPEE
ncbi:hypothetical protein [Nonomuraea gerenzanensis]|uniref:Uncharacterized protein n=1 Tax=Nonomuraea gerenzanensis TaxID=93944 RepID=A0A1M4DXC7_9ACTN|nr:hypothetical protein [Nonomuraea gerenzanensis]UBU13574.1 hypothetical protein LCN96_00605 [Nonomuraea gerenzanensis]SBO91239.1 hypothetical protein BN4615_P753 [Nonomuraea gerenzanensis]